MPATGIPQDLLLVGLEKASGSTFEIFMNALFAALLGERYVPLGGQADGGADGLVALSVHQAATRPGHFVQTTTQEDHRAKVRATIARLREVGRDPKSLTLATSRHIPRLDLVEADLSDELGVSIRIRDRTFIASHINDSAATRGAFDEHLRPLTQFLQHVGATTVVPKSKHVAEPAVYVFLHQELERRSGDVHLASSVVDALIIWALEGTDPDEGRFKTREGVRTTIGDQVPWAERFLAELLDARLETLASKENPGGRAIRWHRKDDLFCLPFETRRTLEEDNAEDEALRIRVRDGFTERIQAHLDDPDDPDLATRAAEVALRAVQLTFESEGLEFSHFLAADQSSENYRTIADYLGEAFAESEVPVEERGLIGDAILRALRHAFYSSSKAERLYFGKLSRTYSLLFTLQAEPRLIEFFQDMTADFYLYVGSDIIVRALSERYLEPEDQMTRNTLKMAATAGATLVLTQPVLEEIVSHLRATDSEFRNFVAPGEQSLNLEMARNASRILIRSYLYARLEPKTQDQPANWESYIGQFCDYGILHKHSAATQVSDYLQAQFNLSYESTEDLQSLVNLREVAQLAEELEEIKTNPQLADNDALMACSIYGRRAALKEHSTVTEFGHRTWWLTSETRILKFTRHLVERHQGERYMMRPEFLLNFISLAPAAAEVRQAYRSIFPSLLGIRLGRRMDEAVFHSLMEGVDEATQLEDGRRLAQIAAMTNSLKSDFWRTYGITFDSS